MTPAAANAHRCVKSCGWMKRWIVSQSATQALTKIVATTDSPAIFSQRHRAREDEDPDLEQRGHDEHREADRDRFDACS